MSKRDSRILLERAEFALGQTTPEVYAEVSMQDMSMQDTSLQHSVFDESQYQYFITVAFPQGFKYKMKHKEFTTRGARIMFDDIRYGLCTQTEQYEWIMWKLSRNIQHIGEKYDIFFEQTKSGDLHFHGRLYSEHKMTMKDIRAYLHRIFETPLRFSHFTDIKVYEHDKWASYDEKVKKDYQTLSYPHFKNI